MMQIIAFIAAVMLPFWNIPLIVRIIKRKSSNDISLYWAIGVWICLLGMFPAGLMSPDIVWKTFNIINFIFFTCVFICTIVFHNKNTSD